MCLGVAGARTEQPVGKEAAGHMVKDFDIKLIKSVEGSHGEKRLSRPCLSHSHWLLCERDKHAGRGKSPEGMVTL